MKTQPGKTILIVSVFLFSLSCFTLSSFAQKKSYADGKGINLLAGLMMYLGESNPDKYKGGFFLGFEYEQPLNNSGSFRIFVVPEMTYWIVENSKNLGIGVNMRGKFRAGSTRPYIDAGFTFNRFSLADVDRNIPGINAGAGIDIPLAATNIAVIIDFKARVHFYESKVKTGFSLAPGIRIGF